MRSSTVTIPKSPLARAGCLSPGTRNASGATSASLEREQHTRMPEQLADHCRSIKHYRTTKFTSKLQAAAKPSPPAACSSMMLSLAVRDSGLDRRCQNNMV